MTLITMVENGNVLKTIPVSIYKCPTELDRAIHLKTKCCCMYWCVICQRTTQAYITIFIQ